MEAKIRRNERSWAIDLITKINEIAKNNDLVIKSADGEVTICAGRKDWMFPDVILYGNVERSIILQGWELKMPDIPIEDEDFIKDAQRKANELNLNSCVIWNFTYAVLYIRGNGNTFRKAKQWNDTSHIRTREDVGTFSKEWETLLEKILIEINEYFVSGQLRSAPLGQIISESAITTLIQRNKDIIAEGLRENAFGDAIMAAYIDTWWAGVRLEYAHDESDKYKAYAKTVILNWANRILFAHIIKSRQNGAREVDEIDHDKTIDEGNAIFEKITDRCDFYNVFVRVKYNDVLPDASWHDFVEFSTFLRDKGINGLNQETLQNILEGSVNTGKRAISGQFTTPTELAKILVRITVRNWFEPILDCCCGTGTIPKEAIQIKKSQMNDKDAVETVWACDKNNYPLQLANISMAASGTINIANRLFRHNALTLTVGEEIGIIDPETGKPVTLKLPEFGAIVSNLPFVMFEKIPDDDKAEISKMPLAKLLDGKSDLYCYIATKIADVLKPGGTLGIIVSNSWLGTRAGMKMIRVLKQRYNLRQVHISGEGRWFKNSDVVTTIIVLERKRGTDIPDTEFWLWNLSLEQLAENPDAENRLIDSALLSSELDCNICKLSKYSPSQIEDILELNVCYNALFHDVEWLLDVRDRIIPIKEVYRVFRGSRRGWDALFFPQNGEHRIEQQYIKKVLKNARNVSELVTVADSDAFCCDASVDELKRRGHTGALSWIEKFTDQRNNIGEPLPLVLKRKGMEWYELKDNEIAEVFTMMNPDQRFFFAKFETPSFVNQRLIGLAHRKDYPDEELNHALINSILTMFSIEASGFARGLGVLDINKDSISNCFMLNPNLVSTEDRRRIINAFEKLKKRTILRVSEELNSADRLEFEHVVLSSFGIDNQFDKIKASLLSMQKARATARK